MFFAAGADGSHRFLAAAARTACQRGTRFALVPCTHLTLSVRVSWAVLCVCQRCHLPGPDTVCLSACTDTTDRTVFAVCLFCVCSLTARPAVCSDRTVFPALSCDGGLCLTMCGINACVRWRLFLVAVFIWVDTVHGVAVCLGQCWPQECMCVNAWRIGRRRPADFPPLLVFLVCVRCCVLLPVHVPW